MNRINFKKLEKDIADQSIQPSFMKEIIVPQLKNLDERIAIIEDELKREREKT